MRTKLPVVLGAGALLVFGLRNDGLAVFTDTATSTGNTFTTGTLDIKLGDGSATPSDSVTASVAFNAMAPGDSVTRPVVVSNAGTNALRYAISSAATNADSKALKDSLALVVKTADVTTPGTPCDNFDGTQLYSGDLDSTAGKILGDSTSGAQTGDRTVAAGATETLCFQVSLALSAGNSLQGAATTATFTFDAEQTANN
ncbi:MAG: TasA family protein [Dehalococcoidia bacterium]